MGADALTGDIHTPGGDGKFISAIFKFTFFREVILYRFFYCFAFYFRFVFLSKSKNK